LFTQAAKLTLHSAVGPRHHYTTDLSLDWVCLLKLLN
jgi:hypothetical protein